MLAEYSTIIILLFVSILLALITFLLFHRVAYKNVFKTLKGYSHEKYGFYECGFRPKHDHIITFNLHIYILLVLTILYDIEGIFLIIFFLNINILSIIDFILIFYYIIFFFIGFAFEAWTHNTEWHFY